MKRVHNILDEEYLDDTLGLVDENYLERCLEMPRVERIKKPVERVRKVDLDANGD